MPFRFVQSEIPEVLIIEPQVFPDERGFFMETYKQTEFSAHGIGDIFVQGNQSKSSRGILRGLHYQKVPKAQGKLVRALVGEIYDVAVDIRLGSPTYGRWVAVVLSAQDKNMLYVPAGFAHGFCVTSDEAEISYMTTVEYAPDAEAGVAWDDPDLGINWPFEQPQVSKRDRSWPRLAKADNNFSFKNKSLFTLDA
jgi:dTDP-4-dehydrorhamnose 3,5-epimerase